MSLILLIACNQEVCYYELPENHLPKYQIYIGQKDYSPLLKNKHGNYFIKLDTSVIHTSTKYEDIANTKSYYSIKGKKDYISEDEMEESFKINIIRNIVGNKTTSEGYFIPDHFEIILEKVKKDF